MSLQIQGALGALTCAGCDALVAGRIHHYSRFMHQLPFTIRFRYNGMNPLTIPFPLPFPRSICLNKFFLGMLAPLKLKGYHLYEWMAQWPPLALFLRLHKHRTIVCHDNPQQVFVADGGTFTLPPHRLKYHFSRIDSC